MLPAFSEFNRLKKEIIVCVCVCVYLLLTERIELRQFSAFLFSNKTSSLFGNPRHPSVYSNAGDQ